MTINPKLPTTEEEFSKEFDLLMDRAVKSKLSTEPIVEALTAALGFTIARFGGSDPQLISMMFSHVMNKTVVCTNYAVKYLEETRCNKLN